MQSLFVRVRYQFAFKTILDGLEKAVARTVRAVQNKSDEIAQVAANIEELELEIGEAMDECVIIVAYGERGDDRWNELDLSSLWVFLSQVLRCTSFEHKIALIVTAEQT